MATKPKMNATTAMRFLIRDSELVFSGESHSAPIPDREASVDDSLRVVIIESDLKHRAVRDWVPRLVRRLCILGGKR